MGPVATLGCGRCCSACVAGSDARPIPGRLSPSRYWTLRPCRRWPHRRRGIGSGIAGCPTSSCRAPAARLAGESPVPKRVVTLYSTILGDRDDAPLFVGIDGRAAVLLRLTGKQRPDLNHLDEALHDDGVQLYLEGHRLDRYGMLRVVLRLPDTDPGLFEAALSLSHGDVQEFVAAAYAHESVELHVFHATDDRALSSTCTGPGLHRLIREAVDAILDADHPATVAEQQEPVAELAGRFRQPADGLSDETMVRLQATRPAQPFVLFASR